MNKSILPLLAALLVAGCPLTAQNLLLPLVKDSSASHFYDSFSGTEQFSSFSYFSYNGDKLPLRDYFIYKYGTGPVYYRYDYTYNALKQLENETSVRSTVSLNGPWANWLKTDYTYDAQGRNNYFLGQLGSGATWENYYQETFWFDDSSPASDSSLYLLWDTPSASWRNYRQYFNYYRPSGDLRRHHEDEWKTSTNAWRFLKRQDFTYYPDGKIRTRTTTSYDVNQVSSVLIDSFLYRQDGKLDTTFTNSTIGINNVTSFTVAKNHYDAGGNLILVNAIIKPNSNASWRPSYKQEFLPGDGFYSNDYSLERYFIFNSMSQSLELQWERTRAYTDLGNNQVFYKESYLQRNGQGLLAPSRLDSVWYHLETVATGAPTHQHRAECLFANPFTPGGNIICHASDEKTPLSIRIMNVSGQVMAQQIVNPGEAWAPSANWPAGLYFLTVWQNGRYLGERRMILK